ncbi:hypothetical protein BDZ90DRAFT_10742 [Jaminaea rosea]|uniref:Uncharacterized protein n=1 Tax=Jaminaea rosea TaxID=1569628 RepID=A0A316UYF2_9BASI|nr:hypothetical protein BDZ90DRAFT_10742 [Jaminaea rosea]PWN30329.1 hypothetical protein BDZ90DRAFT_10742 [Jaminaea rosea]
MQQNGIDEVATRTVGGAASEQCRTRAARRVKSRPYGSDAPLTPSALLLSSLSVLSSISFKAMAIDMDPPPTSGGSISAVVDLDSLCPIYDDLIIWSCFVVL